MKNETYKNKIWIAFAVICCFAFIGNTVYAAGEEKEKVITPGNLKEWDDGADVTKKAEGKSSEYKISVHADTTGLEEDYYSVYLYDYTKRNIKAYDGIQFHYINENDYELKINLTLTVNSKTSVTMAEDSFAVLSDEEQTKTEVIKNTYGTLSIPEHFDGTVYIAFTQLKDEAGEAITLSSIQSWGITTVIEKEKQAVYSIGDIAFLEGSIEARKDRNFLITIAGDEDIVLPNIGSVIEKYSADVIDLEGNEVEADTTFFMEEEIDGVQIREDGTLEIQNDCVATQITLYAKTDNSINAGKITIDLDHVSAEVAAVGVVAADDVKPITSSAYTRLVDSIMWIRLIAVGITVFIGAIFVGWLLKAKKNFEWIRKKLYKELEDEEKEREEES